MSAQVLRQSNPVARKPHVCDVCMTAIAKGERYHRAVLLGDDGLYEWVDCDPCRTLAPVILDWLWDPYEGYTPDDFAEWAEGHKDDAEHGAAARAWLDRRAIAYAAWLARVEAQEGER